MNKKKPTKVFIAYIGQILLNRWNFEHMDTNAQNRSRAYVTGPDFRLTYLFLSCRGTGPMSHLYMKTVFYHKYTCFQSEIKPIVDGTGPILP